uniref:Fanconi-associated nuclease n=1 Tax=Rhizophora mucronata TaxID=61149 RepID=A0A2P2JE72_RHIMU
MESFFCLSDDSQRLFIRLYTRKGPWFRMSSILYPEVLDSQLAVKELSAMGYTCCYDDTNNIQDEDMKDLLDLFTISELREIMCSMKKNCTRGGRKQDLIASILSSYEGGECTFLPSSILDRTGTCIKISSKAESLVWRAERLFFLNGEQDLSAFLLVDLGILKYPSYCCIITEQIFSSRSGLLAYEEAIELAQIMDESLDKSERESVLKCMKIAVSQVSSSTEKAIHTTGSDSLNTSSYFSAPWVYSKVIFVGISFLEHERRQLNSPK